MYNQSQDQYKNITAVSSPVIFAGSGTLYAIVVNNQHSGGTITITDNASPATTVGTIKLATAETSLPPFVYNAVIGGGLQITTTASPDITVLWQK